MLKVLVMLNPTMWLEMDDFQPEFLKRRKNLSECTGKRKKKGKVI